MLKEDTILAAVRGEKFARRFWSKVNKTESCWLWTAGCKSDGYGSMSPVSYTTISSHRASWIMHHGAIPAGMSVLHKCDNPACVNPEHLFLGTQADNMKDCAVKGRCNKPSGEDHYGSKLTSAKVLAIRKALARGETQQSLAEYYGVVQRTISDIKRGKKWKSVTGGVPL